MKNVRTSICGVVALVAAEVGRFYPQHEHVCRMITEIAISLGLFFAKDADKTHSTNGLNPPQHP